MRYVVVLAGLLLWSSSSLMVHAAAPPRVPADVLVTPTPAPTPMVDQTIPPEAALAVVIEQQRFTNNLLLLFFSLIVVVLVFSYWRVR